MNGEEASPDNARELTSLHVRRAKAGDEVSLAWLIARFSPLLRLQAEYRLRGSLLRLYEPDDLVDEVWAVTLPRIANLPHRDGRFTPVLLKFLGTTLLNKANLLIKKSLREKGNQHAFLLGRGEKSRDALDQVPSQVSSALTQAQRDETREAVYAALDELREKDREVLVLRGIEQIPNGEIAKLLGVSPGAVTRRYYEALDRLRQRLPRSIFDEMPRD